MTTETQVQKIKRLTLELTRANNLTTKLETQLKVNTANSEKLEELEQSNQWVNDVNDRLHGDMAGLTNINSELKYNNTVLMQAIKYLTRGTVSK